MDTTIRISIETKDKLEKLKIHPNQSYSEVILKLINQKGGEQYENDTVVEVDEKDDVG